MKKTLKFNLLNNDYSVTKIRYAVTSGRALSIPSLKMLARSNLRVAVGARGGTFKKNRLVHTASVVPHLRQRSSLTAYCAYCVL